MFFCWLNDVCRFWWVHCLQRHSSETATDVTTCFWGLQHFGIESSNWVALWFQDYSLGVKLLNTSSSMTATLLSSSLTILLVVFRASNIWVLKAQVESRLSSTTATLLSRSLTILLVVFRASNLIPAPVLKHLNHSIGTPKSFCVKLCFFVSGLLQLQGLLRSVGIFLQNIKLGHLLLFLWLYSTQSSLTICRLHPFEDQSGFGHDLRGRRQPSRNKPSASDHMQAEGTKITSVLAYWARVLLSSLSSLA